jgi:hypothetical protein
VSLGPIMGRTARAGSASSGRVVKLKMQKNEMAGDFIVFNG